MTQEKALLEAIRETTHFEAAYMGSLLGLIDCDRKLANEFIEASCAIQIAGIDQESIRSYFSHKLALFLAVLDAFKEESLAGISVEDRLKIMFAHEHNYFQMMVGVVACETPDPAEANVAGMELENATTKATEKIIGRKPGTDKASKEELKRILISRLRAFTDKLEEIYARNRN